MQQTIARASTVEATMSGKDDWTSMAAKSERATVLLLAIASALTVILLAELTVVYAPYLIDESATQSQILQAEIM